MPERRPLMRRVAYVSAVMMSSGALVFSLTGIATTQGHVKPNGEAAAAVKRLQQQISAHDCHRGHKATTQQTSQGEV
jgi:hypothetical protein